MRKLKNLSDPGVIVLCEIRINFRLVRQMFQKMFVLIAHIVSESTESTHIEQAA